MEINSILKMLDAKKIAYRFHGNKDVNIQYFDKIDLITDRTVSFCDDITEDICDYFNEKNLVITKNENFNVSIHLPKGNYIFCENTRLVFLYCVKMIEPYKYKDSNLSIGKNSELDCYNIGCNITIGNNCVIKNTTINDNVIIGDNCVVKNTIIYNNVSIQSNCTIGEDGYGYIKKENGEYINFPHIGKVIIEDNVEIHSNTCINRGSLNNTIIRKGCKIHDLVHIGHGAEIGENTLVITGSMIAGSVKIGKNCWISPGTQIIDRISIADDTTIGLGSIVIKSILNSGETWVGNPAKKIK